MTLDQLGQEISDHLALQIKLHAVEGKTAEEYIRDIVHLLDELTVQQDREIARELAIKGAALFLQIGIILSEPPNATKTD